ncbi:MAG: hypothetical protein ABIR84_01160 [Candidatus Nitrotoga sp.]
MNIFLKVSSVFLLLCTSLAQAAHDNAVATKAELLNVNHTYTPGLGEIMVGIQLRHAKLWYAGTASNWKLAEYELEEILEGFDDAKKYQPDFKGKPIAEMIDSITSGPVEKLEQAIKVKDKTAFKKSFDGMSQACNTCHTANGYGFISIQRPTHPPLTNQRYN